MLNLEIHVGPCNRLSMIIYISMRYNIYIHIFECMNATRGVAGGAGI
jgi:hypothetical protein